MSNHEKYKETFEKISMLEEKLQDVENLTAQTKNKMFWKPAVVFAFLCAFMVFSGKMVLDYNTKSTKYEVVTGKISYYAAENDGESDTEQESTVVEKERFVLREENVIVNNDRMSDIITDVYVDEDGLTRYVLSDGSSSAIRIEEPEHTSIFTYEICYEEGGGEGGILAFCGNLQEFNGRIYLGFAEDEEGIDITDDFVDGAATGKIKWNLTSYEFRLEETFEYRVEGTLEDYTVDVWWVESK